mmetsp:Transcript_12294/g.37129  ORF Transcript_12294/g.37129 Transcript_12294/m.37129 type:complete len:232 (+) Transcript_12294:2866-3561(+)
MGTDLIFSNVLASVAGLRHEIVIHNATNHQLFAPVLVGAAWPNTKAYDLRTGDGAEKASELKFARSLHSEPHPLVPEDDDDRVVVDSSVQVRRLKLDQSDLKLISYSHSGTGRESNLLDVLRQPRSALRQKRGLSRPAHGSKAPRRQSRRAPPQDQRQGFRMDVPRDRGERGRRRRRVMNSAFVSSFSIVLLFSHCSFFSCLFIVVLHVFSFVRRTDFRFVAPRSTLRQKC